MKKAIFTLKRDTYRGESTLGIMYDPEGNEFCYVLEDTVRAYGIKDKGNTAIPHTQDDTLYNLTVAESPKYGTVATVYTREQAGMYYVEKGGVVFTMIRVHGGNRHDDTMGCLLVNRHRDISNMTAWGSMKKEFAEIVGKYQADGYSVQLEVINLPQTK